MMSPPHLLKPGRVSLLRLQHNWDASSFSPFVGLDVSLPGRQNNIQVNLERKKIILTLSLSLNQFQIKRQTIQFPILLSTGNLKMLAFI